ncbi:putative gluconate transport inducer 1 [Cercophora samala]|uniref:Gluconate transport inducer 1 n=1 Tax=Cercophora samala TaxID=330535 RepID=A0AA39ZMC4_9PEZI|nr:putative gluconate transport inducer 1 [Cercophora samala]
MAPTASSSPSANVPIEPSWIGYVPDTGTALCLVEAVLRGVLKITARRPQDKERPECIRSGNVFIYEENASGIRRWTDGRNWSPSRIVGNFLVYREIEASLPSDGKTKKDAKKTTSRPVGIKKSPNLGRNHNATTFAVGDGPTNRDITLPNGQVLPYEGTRGAQKLLGSLIDTYPFKQNGLIKRTISFKLPNKTLHAVAYSNLEDYANADFELAFNDPRLRDCFPRESLMEQTWRASYYDDLGAFLPLHQAVWQQQDRDMAIAQQAWISNQAGATFHPTYGMTPHGMAPHGMTTHGMAPQIMAANNMGHHDMAADNMGHHSLAADNMSHHGMAPQIMAADNMGHHSLAADNMSHHGMAPDDMGYHGMAPDDMQAGMHDPSHGFAVANYPIQEHHHPYSPDYPHNAYMLGSADEEAGDVDGQEPRTSVIDHSGLQAQAQVDEYGTVAEGYAPNVPADFQSPVMYQAHHSPHLAHASHIMAQMDYPTHNGTYSAQDGAYEGEDITYPV